MKRKLSILFAAIAWFAILAQFYLMMENRRASVCETTIRFFSFFTILTNLLVAIYFTLIVSKIKNRALAIINHPGTLTAITVYITVVGLVYQVILRYTWQPAGLQMIVDELLHTVMPILVIIYWYLFETQTPAAYRQIPVWLLYPVVYVTYILIRGNISGFYPYPFVDAGNLGLSKVLLNIAVLMALFVVLSAIYIWVGRVTESRRQDAGVNGI